MCTTGLKKTSHNLKTNYQILEVDELYWFIGQKGTGETRENCYVTPVVSRFPRQIVGIDAAFDKSPERIQTLVDAVRPPKTTQRTAFGAMLMWFIRGVTCEIFTIKMIHLRLKV